MTSQKQYQDQLIINFPDQLLYEDRLPLSSGVFPFDVCDRIRRMQLKDGDVTVFGYPKSGTTWLQHIVWLLLNNMEVDTKSNVWDRVPLIEMKAPGQAKSGLDVIEDMASPGRLYKSHLPAWFFDKQIRSRRGKHIVIMRNPKDMLVSYFHFARMRHPKLSIQWDQWFQMFQAKDIQYGDWFEHVAGWWALRDEPNVLILKFEELKADRSSVIRKVSKFLDIQQDEEQMKKLLHLTSFAVMKEDPTTNLKDVSYLKQGGDETFIRRGSIGDWENRLTVEQNNYMDARIKEELDPIGLTFVYDSY